MTTKEVREYLGHGEGNRRVRIKRDDTVEYYGSCDPFDRQNDYWHFAGYLEDICREIEARKYLKSRLGPRCIE